MIRGQKYRFNNTTGSGHPFKIRSASGNNPYTDGVTGDDEGVQFFTVPYTAPSKIFYQCELHSGMIGNIYIRGAGGQNTNVGITTFTGLIDVTQIKKSSGTLDFLAATHTFNNAAASTEYLRINSSGQLSIGAEPASGQGLLNIKPGSGDDTFIKFRRAADFDGTFDGTAIDNRNSANNANKDLIVRFGKMAIWAGGTEKYRINTAGQFGIGGANYGTAGQVLTSTGSSSGLSWKGGGGLQVLEQFSSPADGSSFTTSNGTVTVQNPTDWQALSTTLTDAQGSVITYQPPTGTVQVIYEFQYHIASDTCLLYTSPSPRDRTRSRMPSSA